MSTLDEINEDWQVNGLSPTWAKLQQAKQEQAALIAERDALGAELEDRYRSIIEMGNMRTEIVNLIRGEPEEGTSHSTHDAVELVRGMKAELERIKAHEGSKT